MDVQGSGPAGYRRDDTSVLQVELGGLDRRLIGGEGRFQGGRRGDLGLVLIPRNQSALEQIVVPDTLRLGVFRLRCVPCQNGLGLLQGGLERPGVQHEKRRALLDFLPFRKVNLAQLAGNLGPNLDGGKRFSRSDSRDRHRDRLGDRVRRHDRNGAAASCTPASASADTARPPAPTGGGFRGRLL